eukprot:TRINITY_DN14082_c0_g1_i1.p1 TRINITY_DN14082_c0_g1~~TRINITY_DN14082_c0_g1_i1.p1  ORF type:complete len:500 (+),score=48.83 TRINITY_DN14082_c0_g1_i1:107-1606(+)
MKLTRSVLALGATADEIRALKETFYVKGGVEFRNRAAVSASKIRTIGSTIPTTPWVEILMAFEQSKVYHKELFERIGRRVSNSVRYQSVKSKGKLLANVENLAVTIEILACKIKTPNKPLVNSMLKVLSTVIGRSELQPTVKSYCSALISSAVVDNDRFFAFLSGAFLSADIPSTDLPVLYHFINRLLRLKHVQNNDLYMAFLGNLVIKKSPFLRKGTKRPFGKLDYTLHLSSIYRILSYLQTHNQDQFWEIVDSIKPFILQCPVDQYAVAGFIGIVGSSGVLSAPEVEVLFSKLQPDLLDAPTKTRIIAAISSGKLLRYYPVAQKLISGIDFKDLTEVQINRMLWCSVAVRSVSDSVWNAVSRIRKPSKSTALTVVYCASQASVTKPQLWKLQFQTILQHSVIASLTKNELLRLLESVSRVRLASDAVISTLPENVFKRCSTHLTNSNLTTQFNIGDVKRLCTSFRDMSLKLPDSLVQRMSSRFPQSKEILSSVPTYS